MGQGYSVTTGRIVFNPRLIGSWNLKGGYYLAEKAEHFKHPLQIQRAALWLLNVLNSIPRAPHTLLRSPLTSVPPVSPDLSSSSTGCSVKMP